jgi:hypothetical protein
MEHVPIIVDRDVFYRKYPNCLPAAALQARRFRHAGSIGRSAVGSGASHRRCEIFEPAHEVRQTTGKRFVQNGAKMFPETFGDGCTDGARRSFSFGIFLRRQLRRTKFPRCRSLTHECVLPTGSHGSGLHHDRCDTKNQGDREGHGKNGNPHSSPFRPPCALFSSDCLRSFDKAEGPDVVEWRRFLQAHFRQAHFAGRHTSPERTPMSAPAVWMPARQAESPRGARPVGPTLRPALNSPTM